LESSEIVKTNSPLEVLLISQFIFNALILILIIILLSMLFNRFVLTSNLDFISSLFEKYSSNNINQWFKNKIDKGNDYNNRFILIMFIVNSIMLIVFLFITLFISSELIVNIDSYVNVYNHLKK
jgi:hypothetical protein